MVSSSRSEPAAERRRSRRRWPVRLLAALALLLAAVGGFAAAVRGGWLGGSVRPDAEALVTLELPALGGGVASLKVEGANGQPVAVRDSDGRLWPRNRLA